MLLFISECSNTNSFTNCIFCAGQGPCFQARGSSWALIGTRWGWAKDLVPPARALVLGTGSTAAPCSLSACKETGSVLCLQRTNLCPSLWLSAAARWATLLGRAHPTRHMQQHRSVRRSCYWCSSSHSQTFAQVTLKARQEQQQFLALSINTQQGVVSSSGSICLLLCLNLCFARRMHALVWDLLSAKSQSFWPALGISL